MYSESISAKRIEVSGGINAYAAYQMQVKHSQVVEFDIAVNYQVFEVEVLCCCQLAAAAAGGGVGLRKLSDKLSCFPMS